MAKKSKAERKEQLTRLVCLMLAVLMIGSAIMAALLSQVF